jgi:hypothetical protein
MPDNCRSSNFNIVIRQQTAVIKSIRAHLAEFGIVAPVGRKGVTELLHVVADPINKRWGRRPTNTASGRFCIALYCERS